MTESDGEGKALSDMTDEELEAYVENIRLKRKRGFERKPRKSSKNPLANVPKDVLDKILKILEKSEEST